MVELAFEFLPEVYPPTGVSHLRIAMPSSSTLLPSGYYMLFLVSNQGIPSVAGWVHVS